MSDTNLNNLNLDDLEFLNYEGTAHLVEKVNTKIDEKIAVETERATTKENEISSALEEEISRATSAETTKVDKTTTVNGKALSKNITLTASDVGADASGSADTALTNAKEYANDVYENATSYTDQKIADLINGAPSTLDTLGEISDAMKENESVVEALDQAIGSKANQLEMDSHTGNGTIHITSTERNTWNAVTNKVDKVDGKGLSTNDYTNEEKAQVEANKNDILLLKEDIEGMQGGTNDIATTTSDTLENSKAGGYKLVKMVANTIQNGTPSPSTPIPMLSTGDCVEMIQGYYGYSNGIFNTSKNNVCNKNAIPCKAGDVIDFTLAKYCQELTLIFFTDAYEYITFSSKTDIPANMPCSVNIPSGVSKFVFYIRNSNGITPETVGKITITINGKYVTPIKTHGKNLFNPNTVTKDTYISNSNGQQVSSANSYSSDYIEVVGSKPYFITPELSGGMWGAWYDEKRNFISGINWYGMKHIAPTNAKYMRLTVSVGGNNPNFATNFQVEQNTVATPFEPYRETSAYFLTTYPTIKGSTLFRENGLVKVKHTEKNVLLKNLAWVTYSATPRVYYATVSDCMLGLQKSICSHFVNINGAWDGSDIAYSDHEYSLHKYFKTEFATQSEWEAWLVESNAELQYKLATPIIETLDTESQIALNGLEAFEGVTHVEFDSRVQPLEVTSQYGTTEVGAIALEASNKADMPVDTNDYVHPNSGVTAGTYRSVTVNAQGHVTGGSNPTVTIAQGGTGATTAAGALTNLGITATATELNHVDGVTSNIQTQLNAKQPKEATVFSMQNNYVAVRTSGRTAAQYYEFYDSCGWAGIQAGQITAKVEFVGNLTGNVTGNSATATALTSNGGSATQPVYFSSGKPVACSYTLAKSVPSNAVFTDTVYTHPSSHPSSMITGLGGAATCSVSSATDTTSTTTLLNLTGANNLQKQINTVSTNLGKIKITIKTYTVVPSSSTYVSPYKYFTSENISGDVGTYGTPVYASASGVNGVSLPCKLFRTTSGVWRVDLAAMTDYTITYWVTYISGVSCTIV